MASLARDSEVVALLRAIRDELTGKRNGKKNGPPDIPLIDPTANVLTLVAAAEKRGDDLRFAEQKRVGDILSLTKDFEQELRKVRSEGQRDLIQAESRRIDTLAVAESRRLDAVLAGMKADVALASEKASATAATLAAQVISSAEALRNQVSTTAASTSAQISQLRDSMDKRLTTVEQNQYQAGGAQSQRKEGTQLNQWIIMFLMGLAIAVSNYLSRGH